MVGGSLSWCWSLARFSATIELRKWCNYKVDGVIEENRGVCEYTEASIEDSVEKMTNERKGTDLLHHYSLH